MLFEAKRVWSRAIPVVALVLPMLLACPGAWAQPNPDGRGNPGARGDGPRRGPAMLLERVRQAISDIGLSDEQQVQIEQIFENAREELRGLGPELQQLDQSERQQRTREFMTDLRADVMNILTDEQKPKFEERMDELRRNPRGGERPGAPDGTPGAAPGAGPATAPGADRAGTLLERFRSAVEQLDLSDQQKSQFQELAGQVREKIQTVRAEAQADPQAAREKMREIAQELRSGVQEILTPEQREKLRELMRVAPDGPPMPPPPPQAEPKDQPPPKDGDGRRSAAPAPPESELIRLGQAAPNFALEKLDGRPVQLSSFRGRNLVLLFGNYSLPVFRDSVASFDEVRKQYGRNTDFMIVYTREAHTAGEWQVQRNKDAGILVDQPTDLAGRKELARKARETLSITTPIAIDTMDDKTAQDYGVDPTVTACVVVSRDGVVVARQKWFDGHRLRRQLSELTARAGSTTAPAKPGK